MNVFCVFDDDKGKGKGLQVMYHKGTEGEVPLLILNFSRAPAALPPVQSPGTHCRGRQMGPRAGVDGLEKKKSFAASAVRISDRSARSESLH
jgi:hypothetical protein